MRIDVSSGLWLRCWTTAAKRAAAIASLERHPGVNQPSSLVTPSNYGSSLSLSCTLAHWPLDKYVVISRQTIATYVSAGGNTRTGVRACAWYLLSASVQLCIGRNGLRCFGEASYPEVGTRLMEQQNHPTAGASFSSFSLDLGVFFRRRSSFTVPHAVASSRR